MTEADPRLSPEDGDWELANVVLGELSVTQTLELECRAKLVRELLRGASSSLSADIPLTAEKAGVSIRTVERWISGYRRAGVAGLADKRLLRTRRSGVDPRWDAACIQVLDQHVNASTPTVGVLIDRVQQQLEKTFGPDEVPCPSRSTAFRRIKLIAKGRHSFGSAKQRRSVAQRPEGPYGRLRATRPGEYVVLDTTPPRRLRHGACDASLGSSRAHSRAGSFHQMHPGSPAFAGINQLSRRSERALPVRHPNARR